MENLSESWNSLDAALAGVIAYKHEGGNHHADWYFMKMSSDYKPSEVEKGIIMDRLKKLLLQIEAKMVLVKEDETGTTVVEYALLVMFIAALCAGAFELLGGSVKAFIDIANKMLPF